MINRLSRTTAWFLALSLCFGNAGASRAISALRVQSVEGAGFEELASRLRPVLQAAGLEEVSLGNVVEKLRHDGTQRLMKRLRNGPAVTHVFLDLDGSAALPDENVSAASLRIQRSFMRAGGHIFYNTARSTEHAKGRVSYSEMLERLSSDLAHTMSVQNPSAARTTAEYRMRVYGRYGSQQVSEAVRARHLRGAPYLTEKYLKELLEKAAPGLSDAIFAMLERDDSLWAMDMSGASPGRMFKFGNRNPEILSRSGADFDLWQRQIRDNQIQLTQSQQKALLSNPDLTEAFRWGDIIVMTEPGPQPAFAVLILDGLLNRIHRDASSGRLLFDPREQLVYRLNQLTEKSIFFSQSGRRTVNVGLVSKYVLIQALMQKLDLKPPQIAFLDDEGEGGGREALELLAGMQGSSLQECPVPLLLGPPVPDLLGYGVYNLTQRGPAGHDTAVRLFDAKLRNEPLRLLSDQEISLVASGLNSEDPQAQEAMGLLQSEGTFRGDLEAVGARLRDLRGGRLEPIQTMEALQAEISRNRFPASEVAPRLHRVVVTPSAVSEGVLSSLAAIQPVPYVKILAETPSQKNSIESQIAAILPEESHIDWSVDLLTSNYDEATAIEYIRADWNQLGLMEFAVVRNRLDLERLLVHGFGIPAEQFESVLRPLAKRSAALWAA